MKRVSLICAVLLVLSRAAAPQTANPLLETTLPVPFDRIKAEHVVPAVRQLLETAKKQHEAYVLSSDPLTFENTILALDHVGEELKRSVLIASLLGMVISTPEMRAALGQVTPPVTAFQSGISLDPRVWKKIKQYAATEEAKSLTGSRKRLLELTIRRFRRAGADLDEASRKRLREINVDLARWSRKFGDNVLESSNAFELVVTDETKLAGLPETARIAARQAAKDKGVEGWRFTLQAPSVQAVGAYLDDATIREKILRGQSAVASAGAQDNRPVIRRIIQLRRERANLLGYRTWADYQTEEWMAGSGAKAQEFLATLETKTRPAFQREKEEWLSFRRGLEGPQAPPLAFWDVGYYSQKLRQERYALDPEALRPYFPFDSVLKGLFEIAGRLYGVKFTKVTGAPVWDPAVEYFEVRDADGKILGFFYTDFYARPNKRAGAWAGAYPPVSPALPKVGVIVGNVTPPAGGRPALLRHSEVNTLFHEFGHLMAGLLNRVPERGLRDFVLDFVELPSQIMQNFTWRRECLDLFARHYKTGERIPDELFKRMLAARNFGAASAQMQQVGLGTLDLALHSVYDPAREPDPIAFTLPIVQRFAPAQLPERTSIITRFLHLFGGFYSAGYYSYKWAEVLEADAFSRFEKEGVLNPKTGMEFRKKILERGNSADAAELFRDFMGRDPDPDAMLRRSGLLPAK